jgi:hypothetical protein
MKYFHLNLIIILLIINIIMETTTNLSNTNLYELRN